MKIIGNIFANNYWLMKFAPLALALATADEDVSLTLHLLVTA